MSRENTLWLLERDKNTSILYAQSFLENMGNFSILNIHEGDWELVRRNMEMIKNRSLYLLHGSLDIYKDWRMYYEL